MKINRETISDHLLEYQLDMVGKTVAEAYKTEEWYSKWTITEEQHEQFKSYAVPLLKKVFKCNKKRAEDIFGWFDLQFGLRINNNPTQQQFEEL
jgi:hypothetical protein